MSGGGSGSTSNTVSEFKPPSYTQAPWENLVNQGNGLAISGLPVYTGQTVAPISQQSQVGIPMLTSLATQGSPLYDSAQGNLIDQLTGRNVNPYVGNNPYLQSMLNASNQDISDVYTKATAPQLSGSMAKQGAFGGSDYSSDLGQNQLQLARALAQNESNVRGANYSQSANLTESGLGRQLQAAQMAPGFQGSDIQAIQAMMGGGDVTQQYQQQLLDAAKGIFNQFTQAPWTLQDLLGSTLSRASGQGGTTTQQNLGPSTSFGQGLLGLGALGGGLYNAFG